MPTALDAHAALPDDLSREQFGRYRVVVATLCLAGKLWNQFDCKRGHFDAIFIDEAGQATEPETCAAIASLLDPCDGLLVVAGDPKQLGPVVHSTIAKDLEVSLLERLIARECYRRDDEAFGSAHYDARCMTKLIENYRSHPAIIQVPNDLFYNGDLECKADKHVSHVFASWEHLPAPGFPIIFHGIVGKDQREAQSPSWFNSDEAVQVLKCPNQSILVKTRIMSLFPAERKKEDPPTHAQNMMDSTPPHKPRNPTHRYVKLLLHARGRGLTEAEIGVITPYNKQVQKLSRLLRAEGHGEIKVGSTETFQGQERRVIIISTVRSSAEHLAFDARHHLGFLANPKRFNVAVTRAQALLIVIGNPRVLQTDAHWGALLRHCVKHGGYTGAPLHDEPGQDVERLCEFLLHAMPVPIDDGNDDDDDDGEVEDARVSTRAQQEYLPMPSYD